LTDDEHLTGWGKVAGNLLTVEHVMRIFLCEANGEKLEYPAPGQADVAVSHLTNRDSLGDVIREFNDQLHSAEANFKVDTSIVQIRDALAHGRLATLAGSPVTLYKFGHEQSGRVPVENADLLDAKWFDDKRILLSEQIDRVINCSRSRAYKMLK
jgi:hypothetical protein